MDVYGTYRKTSSDISKDISAPLSTDFNSGLPNKVRFHTKATSGNPRIEEKHHLQWVVPKL